MKQELQGKIFVGIIISLIAFGFATGAGIFIDTNPVNSVGVLSMNQGKFQFIYTTPDNVSTKSSKNTPKTNKPTTNQSNTYTPTEHVKNNPTKDDNNNNNNNNTSR